MMETRHIGSNERAALIKLYAQYEYKELGCDNHDVSMGSYITELNRFGRDGWRIASSDWNDEGVVFILQRQTFSMENAIKRARDGA